MKKLGFALAIALVAAVAQPAMAGEAFLKGGYIVSPSGLGARNSWYISLGSDYTLTEVAYLGFDIQSAYQSTSVPGVANLTAVPTNVFVNGKWKMERDGIRPYGGGGLGMVAAFTKTSVPGVPGSNYGYNSDAGFQFMGGAEFNQKWIAEFRGQKQFQTGVPWNFSFGGGFRW